MKSCDPWNTTTFIVEMSKLDQSQCSHCLSDCDSVKYQVSSTSNKIEACDSTNLNLSPLCDILNKNNDIEATIWGDAAKATYDPENTPDYVHKILGPMRKYYINDARADRELLQSLVHGQVSYNAFERDIAIINIFYGDATAMEYERGLKMTAIDFISSLGGLFGLFLGFSLLSFVEIIYWFIVVFGRQMILGK